MEEPIPKRADRAARHYGVSLLVAFAVLGGLVALRWPPIVVHDLSTDLAVHAVLLRDPALLTIATFVTNAGSPASIDIVTVLVAGWLLYRRRMSAAVYLVATRLVELGIETAVKNLVGRPRPALPDPVAHASSFSFPSGHTGGTAVLCVALLMLATHRPRAPWAALATVAIISVATSRVLLGVHYPSDVIGGALLGITCALMLRPLLTLVDPRAEVPPESKQQLLRSP
jgi:undecaprenyl-diphosphatase